MQARKLAQTAALAWLLLASSAARAEVERGEPASVRRAELDGPDLKLCVERGERFETLIADSEDPDAPLRSEPGCADFGNGVRLPIHDFESEGAVHVEGRIAVYIDRDGNALRIPLDLADDEGPYEASREPDECDPSDAGHACEPRARDRSDPCDGDRCIRRVPTRRGSHRIVLPGPRAGEIGDATRDATLNGLEQVLDPITEPPLALTLRGVSAVVGFAVGTALYVPTTLLDVLETEYGAEPDAEPVECDPYDGPYDRDEPYEWDEPRPYERHRRCH